MIIVKLFGGLGNQMFQYATGRALAYRHDTEIKLDISAFRKDPSRTYNLSPFNIKENFASDQDLRRVRKQSLIFIAGVFFDFKACLRREISLTHRNEKHFHFDPEILDLPDNVYLEGYWQSEKYFKDIEEIIRDEFQIKIPPDALNSKIKNDIATTESVSIHIRRGDYVTNPVANNLLGLCDISYYKKAIEDISRKLDSPVFFIFSDDPEWTRKNLKSDCPLVYVCHNGPEKSYEDLRLMTTCHHHIIANSSFSWWGAWLCNHPDKIVYAPEKWFSQPSMEIKDLIPNSWIKLRIA